ncbi:MAG: hypothetical protein NTW78_01935 [Campylobacterales bacterium]|nr:hypothetical protein [Campylobacterales bacterium]
MQTIDYLIIISERMLCEEDTLDTLQKRIMALEEKLGMHSHMPTKVSK